LIASFRYPRRGPGMMWEAAARKIQENGGRIVMDRKFEKLRFDPERQIWGVDTISSGGTCETFEARHVVSSAPILELLAALSPSPLTLLHARALKYSDFITVVLIGVHDGQFGFSLFRLARPRWCSVWARRRENPGDRGGVRMVFWHSRLRPAIRRRRHGLGGRDLRGPSA
jgi:protoporphyrinogen oxidase